MIAIQEAACQRVNAGTSASIAPSPSATTAEATPRPRILVATDAWAPQVNGVSRTYEWLREEARGLGVDIIMLTPEGHASFPVPTYPGLRLALPAPGAIGRAIETADPHAVHIATEGPVGTLARLHCLRTGRKFTTCYHTKFPEYIAARWPVPLSWSYARLRRFHGAAAATLVATPSLHRELDARGFTGLVSWRRGIPLQRFASARRDVWPWAGPYFLYTGRIAVDKNLAAFLSLDLPGAKILVGDGPERARLAQQFPDAHFLGRLDNGVLARAYASADVFVFPSLTDTYGLVMLEAMAAGTPVAAFPVTGPRDVLGDSGCGVLDNDLRQAALAALEIPRDRCRAYAATHSMRESAKAFIGIVANAVGMRLPDSAAYSAA